MEPNGNVEATNVTPLHQRKRAQSVGEWEYTGRFFEDCHAVFMWEGKLSGVDKTKTKIVIRRFHEKGGWRSTEVDANTTHLIANCWSVVLSHHWGCQKCPFRIQSQVKCVSYEWIIACLLAGQKVPERFFRIDQGADLKSQLENFEKACGVVGTDGKWIFQPEKATLTKEELEQPELTRDDAQVRSKALEIGARLVFDSPPWIELPPKRNDALIFNPPAWLLE